MLRLIFTYAWVYRLFKFGKRLLGEDFNTAFSDYDINADRRQMLSQFSLRFKIRKAQAD